MEDDEQGHVDWQKILITIAAGLVIVLVVGAAAVFLATGRLEFPNFAPAIKPVATANGYEVSLSWEPAAGAQSYSVYRSQKEGDTGVLVAKNITAARYSDIVGYEGTYYYSVRYALASGIEDGKPVQAMVEVKKRQLGTIGQAQISFANGNYTNSTAAIVKVSAQGATSCRFWLDNSQKGDYTRDFQSHEITLSGGDGQKTVNVECRNAESGPADSTSAQAEITLDTTGPSIQIIHSSVPYNVDNMTVQFSADDTYSGALACAPAWDGEVIGNLSPYAPGEKQTVTFVGSGSNKTYNVSIACADGAGNLAFSKSLAFTTAVKNETPAVALSFKWSAPFVNYPEVTLVVKSAGAGSCRFKNEDNSWSLWQNYSTANLGNEFGWKLSGSYGTKTVYAECRDSTLQSLGTGSASIMYAPPGSNGWYPG
ncbi:MAG: hypothetical protein WC506_02150 [Candidatus Micrarchaeia archaeon]